MELEGQRPKVLIRKFRYGDEKAIIRLVNEGTMVTVNPFFLRSATREIIVSFLMIMPENLFGVLKCVNKYTLFLFSGPNHFDVCCHFIHHGRNVIKI